MFACIVDMSYRCWQRATDVRMLKESQIEEGQIRFTPSKTAVSSRKMVDICISPQIQEVIDQARAAKLKYGIVSDYLFPKKTNRIKIRIVSMSGRARNRAEITEGVMFKHLRALGATDAAKAGQQMKAIQTRLAHTSSRTSEI